MADDRATLYLNLSDEAHAGWRLATRAYGGNPTTLGEVIGQALAALDGPRSKLPKHWRVWFAQAEILEEARRKSQGRRQE